MLSTSFQSPMRWPSRLLGNTWGAALMFSCPPAMMISLSPSRMAWAASITAFRPEPQTLLMVKAGTSSGRPDFTTAWRAAFWPLPAVSTWPRITSLICAPLKPLRSSRALITVAPNSGAEVLARVPPNLPTAVRAAATITMSVVMGQVSSRKNRNRSDAEMVRRFRPSA